MEKKGEEGEKKANLEGLPLETSPYTQYKDLEDYKKQGYGAEGHLQPNPNPARGAGASTDAPTATATAAADNTKAEPPSSTDAVKDQVVP